MSAEAAVEENGVGVVDGNAKLSGQRLAGARDTQRSEKFCCRSARTYRARRKFARVECFACGRVGRVASILEVACDDVVFVVVEMELDDVSLVGLDVVWGESQVAVLADLDDDGLGRCHGSDQGEGADGDSVIHSVCMW